MKKKLTLDELKVKSFIVHQNITNTDTIKGGEPDTAIKECRPSQLPCIPASRDCDPDDFFTARLCTKELCTRDQRAC